MVISDSIRYVGVNDNDIDLFEGQYIVPNGVSYNSYLIKDEKTALLDTVDIHKYDEWEKTLEAELGGKAPDYLVIHHLEPDHAGSIVKIIEKYPNITLVGNAKTFAMLPQFFEISDSVEKLTVKEGDTLALGSHTLTFIMAPMVHWPEVMVVTKKAKRFFSAPTLSENSALSEQTKTGLAKQEDITSTSLANTALPFRLFLKRRQTLILPRSAHSTVLFLTAILIITWVFIRHGAVTLPKKRAYLLLTLQSTATQRTPL